MNKELILRLASCEYITEYHNVFITGKTGTGKTYLACAFGMEACKQYYKTYFIRLPDLLIALRKARENGTYLKVLTKYANVTLLIIDEYRIIGRLAPSTGSISAGQAAQHAPDRWLKPHRTGGSAAPEYSHYCDKLKEILIQWNPDRIYEYLLQEFANGNLKKNDAQGVIMSHILKYLY